MSDDFEDLVRKHVKAEREKQLNEQDYKRARIQWWQLEVEKLYTEIQHWLEPLIRDGLVFFRPQEIQVHEELLGPYPTHSATITLGNLSLKLDPIGTVIIGSFGRIDVQGPEGSVMLVLQAQKPTPETAFKPSDPVWHIVRRDQQNRIQIELNKSSFNNLLSGLFGIGG